MSNVMTIAKKEFSDLIGSKFVIILTIIYLAQFAIDMQYASALFNSRGIISMWGNGHVTLLTSVVDDLGSIMLFFSCILGVVIGYTSIFNEKKSYAINTLITKPVFRDGIINGKFLGTFVFFLCFFTFMVALYTSFIMMILKNAMLPIFMDYLMNVPVIIFLSLLFVMVFYSLSVLVSLIVREQSLSLLICALLWALVMQFIPLNQFSGYISLFFGSNQLYVQQLINGFSPQITIYAILMDNSGNLFEILMINWTYIFKFVIIIIVLMILDYIAFLRRDIV